MNDQRSRRSIKHFKISLLKRVPPPNCASIYIPQ
ncbi:unnamed protein product [Toxocara canis]|uniref:Uncharacterized protein n=1 Tax=Toxocara canis TaxID=6265 RepID=A0A3P7FIK6_TOXCA|nr:unnamed protein product [Toxocara canis]